jgi:hypothetical protein
MDAKDNGTLPPEVEANMFEFPIDQIPGWVIRGALPHVAEQWGR